MKSIKRMTIHCVRERVATYHRVLMASPGVAALARELISHHDQEVVIVLLLDAKNRCIGYTEVARGTITGALLHPREVFRAAILQGATSVIVCHNHPSGDATPSAEDHAITAKLRECATLLDVPLLDHVIVADHGAYFSFLDAGLLATA